MNPSGLSTEISESEEFQQHYRQMIARMRLRGFQLKTVNAYARELCRAWHYFAGKIEETNEDAWCRYFSILHEKGSWTMVKNARYGLAF